MSRIYFKIVHFLSPPFLGILVAGDIPLHYDFLIEKLQFKSFIAYDNFYSSKAQNHFLSLSSD
jgi:hypothetical protein